MTESRRFDHALFPRSSDFFFLSLDCMHEQYFPLSPPLLFYLRESEIRPALPWICAITKNDKNTSCIQGNYVQGHLAPPVGYICPRFSLFIFCPSSPPFNRIAPGERSHRYLRERVGTLAADGDAWTKLAPHTILSLCRAHRVCPQKKGKIGQKWGSEGEGTEGHEKAPNSRPHTWYNCFCAKVQKGRFLLCFERALFLFSFPFFWRVFGKGRPPPLSTLLLPSGVADGDRPTPFPHLPSFSTPIMFCRPPLHRLFFYCHGNAKVFFLLFSPLSRLPLKGWCRKLEQKGRFGEESIATAKGAKCLFLF